MKQIIGCEKCGCPAEKRPVLCVDCLAELKGISYQPDTVKIKELLSVISALKMSNKERMKLIIDQSASLDKKDRDILMLTERCARYKTLIDEILSKWKDKLNKALQPPKNLKGDEKCK